MRTPPARPGRGRSSRPGADDGVERLADPPAGEVQLGEVALEPGGTGMVLLGRRQGAPGPGRRPRRRGPAQRVRRRCGRDHSRHRGYGRHGGRACRRTASPCRSSPLAAMSGSARRYQAEWFGSLVVSSIHRDVSVMPSQSLRWRSRQANRARSGSPPPPLRWAGARLHLLGHEVEGRPHEASVSASMAAPSVERRASTSASVAIS